MGRRTQQKAVRLGGGALLAAGLALGQPAFAASLDGSGGPVRLLDADGDGAVSFLLTAISPVPSGFLPTSGAGGGGLGSASLYYSLNGGGWNPLWGEQVRLTARNQDILDLAIDRNGSAGIDPSDLFLSNSDHAVVTYLDQQAGGRNTVVIGWKTSQFCMDTLSSSSDSFQPVPLPGAAWFLASGLGALRVVGIRRRREAGG